MERAEINRRRAVDDAAADEWDAIARAHLRARENFIDRAIQLRETPENARRLADMFSLVDAY